MSEQEQNSKLGSALKDLAETRLEFACLKKKLEDMAAGIQRVSEGLKQATYSSSGSEPEINILRDYPASEEIRDTVRDLYGARDKIHGLEEFIKEGSGVSV